MTPDDAGGAQPAPSFSEAATNLGVRALGFANTRLELAGVELAEARARLVRSLLLIGLALLFALLALVVASVGVIAWFWDTSRFTAIIVLALVYAIAGAALWYRQVALAREAPTLFAATLDALRADAAALRPGAGRDAAS